MESILSKKEDVIAKNINGETVLLIPATGKYFGLNAVGTSFWEQIDGKTPLPVIVAKIAEEYEVDLSTVATDIDELIAELVANHLIKLK